MTELSQVLEKLGELRGTQTQILDAVERMRDDFAEHKDQDQVAFSGVRALVFKERDTIRLKLDELITAREINKANYSFGRKTVQAIGAFILFCLSVFTAYKQFKH